MEQIARIVGEKLLDKGWMLTTAESCTGGMISMLVTDVAGSSQWFDRGFVTYTNESKQQMLGVSETTLVRYGAVSLQTVAEMAKGAITNSSAHCSIAISGIAGPGGGSEQKPVGTVCIAWLTPKTDVISESYLFSGGREQIRKQAAFQALNRLAELI